MKVHVKLIYLAIEIFALCLKCISSISYSTHRNRCKLFMSSELCLQSISFTFFDEIIKCKRFEKRKKHFFLAVKTCFYICVLVNFMSVLLTAVLWSKLLIVQIDWNNVRKRNTFPSLFIKFLITWRKTPLKQSFSSNHFRNNKSNF